MYDIEEYAKKAKVALTKLEQTQNPGEVSGKGNKSDVVLAIKADIQKLLEKGYTSKQIATALKEGDVFGILPKTITELMSGKKAQATRVKQVRKRKAEKKQENERRTEKSKENGKENPASFDVKPDTDDL